MHASVLSKWHEFSEPLEGRVHWLYVDVKRLLTAGVGNLADPVSLALQMPWSLPDGSPASKEEVVKQWHAVKVEAARLSKLHFKYAKSLTTIRLTDDAIDGFVAKRLATTEKSLKKAYPDWDSFPADAQLGCLSMAWAVGDGFPAIFKNFTRFVLVQDWRNAKLCCKIKDGLSTPTKTDDNPGIVPRNKNNELCFENAAAVIERGLDIGVLNWPNAAPDAPETVVPEMVGITSADLARHAAFMADYARRLVESDVHDALREMSGMVPDDDDLVT